MGWASGGRIFDSVAQGLIDARASEEVKRRVLGDLIEALQREDWDTEDESLEAFKGDPVIVELFAEHGVELAGDEK